jgi:hypothetical protein
MRLLKGTDYLLGQCVVPYVSDPGLSVRGERVFKPAETDAPRQNQDDLEERMTKAFPLGSLRLS